VIVYKTFLWEAAAVLAVCSLFIQRLTLPTDSEWVRGHMLTEARRAVRRASWRRFVVRFLGGLAVCAAATVLGLHSEGLFEKSKSEAGHWMAIGGRTIFVTESSSQGSMEGVIAFVLMAFGPAFVFASYLEASWMILRGRAGRHKTDVPSGPLKIQNPW
jgi:hypothetical protein